MRGEPQGAEASRSHPKFERARIVSEFLREQAGGLKNYDVKGCGARFVVPGNFQKPQGEKLCRE
jgi:hypothetical protein